MLNDKVIRTAFLISFTGHCLFLGTLGFNLRLPIEIKEEEFIVNLEIAKPSLLPKIDIIGEEKKFKKVAKKQSEPESWPRPQPKEVIMEEMLKDPIEQKIEIIDPAQEAMLRYQDMVKQKIEECRRYPNWAKRQGVEGVSCLTFTLLSSGMIQDIKITHSSGFDILDEEAISTVKRASPFKPIPEKFNCSSFTMEVVIVFQLKWV